MDREQSRNIPYEDADREVTLEEILSARESRVRDQEKLLSQYHVPLISFTMNIAGPIKNSPLIRKSFHAGKLMLENKLKESGYDILLCREKDEATGSEALYAVDADAMKLKTLCLSIEDSCELGRLFDMDVLDTDGRKLDRPAERPCLVCGAPGRGCASRRTHPLSEIQTRTRQIMAHHFKEQFCTQIADMVNAALIEEVMLTPKPGLVDQRNNGSHPDMNIDTFLKSAAALKGYWHDCVRIGIDTREDSPGETFRQLRIAGKNAEAAMFEATGGINTHKGAIFLFGVICGAIGRLSHDDIGPDIKQISAMSRDMTKEIIEHELNTLKHTPEKAQTAGEKIWIRYGLKGVRGEIAEGLPRVMRTSLPVFSKMLEKGKSRQQAGITALLSLIAEGKDTNMIHRGGMETALAAAARAAAILSKDEDINLEQVEKLDDEFIEKNLSPGGCSDLLGITFFLYDFPACLPHV